MLSMQPAAVRQRRRREKKRAATEKRAPASSGVTVTGLYATAPVTGPGPEAFAAPPFASDGTTPLVGEPPAAPRPPMTEAEAAPAALLLVTFYRLGVGELLAKRKSLTARINKLLSLEQALAQSSAIVYASTVRCCIKYDVGHLADEWVVGGAIGAALLGFAVKPEDGAKDGGAKNDNAEVTHDTPPDGAKDANGVPAPDAGDMTPEAMDRMGIS